MSKRYKIITCFVPSGIGLGLLERLREEHGISSAYAHHARGVGVGTRAGRSFFAVEREIVTVLVPEAHADAIFEFLYAAAGLGEPNSGMVLMQRAMRASPLGEPEVPQVNA